jgi:hypothetical protein
MPINQKHNIKPWNNKELRGLVKCLKSGQSHNQLKSKKLESK